METYFWLFVVTLVAAAALLFWCLSLRGELNSLNRMMSSLEGRNKYLKDQLDLTEKRDRSAHVLTDGQNLLVSVNDEVWFGLHQAQDCDNVLVLTRASPVLVTKLLSGERSTGAGLR